MPRSDDELQSEIDSALDSFKELGDEAASKVRMSYEEQCVRSMVRCLPEESRSVVQDEIKAGEPWTFDTVHGVFSCLPAQLIASDPGNRRSVSAFTALRRGNLAPIIDVYYEERARIEMCPQCVACFIRARDWGNVVIHSLIWAGDETIRSSIPRILIPARGEPGELLIIEARKTFAKFFAGVSLTAI